MRGRKSWRSSPFRSAVTLSGNHRKHVGDGLSIVGDHCTVVGERNRVTGVRNTVTGARNTVVGDRNTVAGDFNTCTGQHFEVRGDCNTVNGHHAKVFGDRNTIHGDHAKVVGKQNTIRGDHAKVGGDSNIIHGNHGAANGDANTVNPTIAKTLEWALGTLLHTNDDHSTPRPKPPTLGTAPTAPTAPAAAAAAVAPTTTAIPGDFSDAWTGAVVRSFTGWLVDQAFPSPSAPPAPQLQPEPHINPPSAPTPTPTPTPTAPPLSGGGGDPVVGDPERFGRPVGPPIGAMSMCMGPTGATGATGVAGPRMCWEPAPVAFAPPCWATGIGDPSPRCHAEPFRNPSELERRRPVEAKEVGQDGKMAVSLPAAEKDEPTLDESAQCCVCLSNRARTTFLECGHSNVCVGCARQIVLKGSNKCPTCQATIARVIRTYN